MKKLAFLLVLVVAFALMGGVALAADNPHGPFQANTDVCAACHRAHTATAEYLLSSPSITGMCIACHDGTAADCNVVGGAYYSNGTENNGVSGYNHADWGAMAYPLMGGGFESIGTSIAVTGTTGTTSKHMKPLDSAKTIFQYQWGQGAGYPGAGGPGRAKTSLDCVDCHTPHYGANYRMLRQKPTGYNGTPLLVPTQAYVTSALGRKYTEDVGRFNTQLNMAAPYSSISQWCGFGCHDYYYRSALRMDNGHIGPPAMSPQLSTRVTVDATGASADLTVADNTIIKSGAGNSYVVVNGTTYFAHRGAAGILTLQAGNWPNTIHVADIVTGTGQGSEIYYNLDGVAGNDVGFMHAVDVDLNYAPRNGSTVNQDLSANLNNVPANSSYLLPVAVKSTDPINQTTYTNGRIMTCETCHRAHGTDVAMTGRAAIAQLDRQVGNGAGGYTSLPYGSGGATQGSMLLRIENRGICEYCHNMPNGF